MAFYSPYGFPVDVLAAGMGPKPGSDVPASQYPTSQDEFSMESMGLAAYPTGASYSISSHGPPPELGQHNQFVAQDHSLSPQAYSPNQSHTPVFPTNSSPLRDRRHSAFPHISLPIGHPDYYTLQKAVNDSMLEAASRARRRESAPDTHQSRSGGRVLSAAILPSAYHPVFHVPPRQHGLFHHQDMEYVPQYAHHDHVAASYYSPERGQVKSHNHCLQNRLSHIAAELRKYYIYSLLSSCRAATKLGSIISLTAYLI